MLIGVISDTHGSLPAFADAAFKGVGLIIHAGDVGSPTVLAQLELLAPVIAVRGNMDAETELSALPDHRRLEVEGVRLLVVHRSEHVPSLVSAESADVIITGHTHRPRVERSGDSLLLNPGSASRSVGEGRSVALLHIENRVPHAEIVRE